MSPRPDHHELRLRNAAPSLSVIALWPVAAGNERVTPTHVGAVALGE
jgi:hypothetical protein